MRALFILSLSTILGGCVSMRVVRVDPERPHRAKGFRYCMPQPFLLVREAPVTRDVKRPVVLNGKVVKGAYEESVVHEGRFEIVYLPDPQRTFAVTPRTFLSGQEIELEFEEGWKLTRVQGKQEGALAAEALAEMMEALVGGAVDAGEMVVDAQAQTAKPMEPAPSGRAVPPGLYRIRFDEDGTVRLSRAMILWETGSPGKDRQSFLKWRTEGTEDR